jgi:hypothetical protein
LVPQAKMRLRGLNVDFTRYETVVAIGSIGHRKWRLAHPQGLLQLLRRENEAACSPNRRFAAVPSRSVATHVPAPTISLDHRVG